MAKRRPANPHSDALQKQMDTLLEQWRPENLAVDAQMEIPMLTDAVKDAPGNAADQPPVPMGMTREVLQGHLAVAAETVMQELYRELAGDLHEHVYERLRETVDTAVDQALQHAMNSLRRQILLRVTEAMTDSIESIGRGSTAHSD